MRSKRILVLIALAIIFKSALFVYAISSAPDLKTRPDTHLYLDSGISLASNGVFEKINPDGSRSPQHYRTPGYPLFLGVSHGLLKIPLNGVIYLQILLTLLSAIFVYKAADKINPRLGMIAFFIILFDPAITIYSLMLLTESLFLFFMGLFMYTMITYIQGKDKKHLLLSAVILAAATYVRPITLYLGVMLAVFIFVTSFRIDLKKSIFHALIFLITVHSLLFLWQWRNYTHFQDFQFSNIEASTVKHQGIYKSYSRNKDPISQNLSPVPYYINVASRCLLSLYTRPVSMKYFESDMIKKTGKIFSYLWIAFWMIGFIRGLGNMNSSPYFCFILLIIFYLSTTTIVGVMWVADGRFRIPMMPYIAIIAAHGWSQIGAKSIKNFNKD